MPISFRGRPSKPPNRIRRRGGFVLLEALFALAITGVIAGSAYVSVSSALRTAERTNEAYRVYLELAKDYLEILAEVTDAEPLPED